jgi:membrane associated rhomboid family serine protease
MVQHWGFGFLNQRKATASMLIVPLSKKIGWKNPPLVTLALLIINCLVFFLFQINDDQASLAAETFYLESGLAQIEVPHYDQYVAGKGASHEPAEPIDLDDPDAVLTRHFEMEADAYFIRALMADRIVRPDDAQYDQWRALRRDYEEKREQSVAFAHGLRPAFPRAPSFLTYMFLHGGVGHLLGNMAFLWILGCMLEMGAGRALFSGLYLISGLLAAGLFYLVYPSSTMPLVGASGAIAGLMGAYTVLYGRRRVSVFYSLGVYFNTADIPAIFLLPVWLGNECYQLFFSGASHVAYVAHIGGLVGGAVLAFAGDRLTSSVDRDSFTEVAEDRVSPLMDQALELLGNLEMDQARDRLEAILEISPDHPEALNHLFNIHKLNPDSAAFHETTGQLLKVWLKHSDTHPQALVLYRTYRGITRRPSLSIPLYLQIAGIMAGNGETADAERIVLAIFKQKPQTPGLPASLIKLAKAFHASGQLDRWTRYRRLVCQHFPDSVEAGMILRSETSR